MSSLLEKASKSKWKETQMSKGVTLISRCRDFLSGLVTKRPRTTISMQGWPPMKTVQWSSLWMRAKFTCHRVTRSLKNMKFIGWGPMSIWKRSLMSQNCQRGSRKRRRRFRRRRPWDGRVSWPWEPPLPSMRSTWTPPRWTLWMIKMTSPRKILSTRKKFKLISSASIMKWGWKRMMRSERGRKRQKSKPPLIRMPRKSHLLKAKWPKILLMSPKW